MKIEVLKIEGTPELGDVKNVTVRFAENSDSYAIVTVRVEIRSDSLAEVKEAAVTKVAALMSRYLSPDAPPRPFDSFS